jgi:glycerophosphoryl diester phosphodiesterase
VDVLSRHPTMPFVIEIKGEAPGAVPAILDAVDRAGARDRVIVGAFSHAVLDEIRRRAPDVPTSASGDELRSAVRRTRVFLRPRSGAYRLLQAPYRYRGRTVFGRRFAAGARRAGLPVHAWIVDEEADMRKLVSWGVTGLISDRPDVAVRVRDA